MTHQEFERVALPHLDATYRLARSLTSNHEDAADIVQETYLKAFKAAGRFRDYGAGIRPWLFRILRNVFYTHRTNANRVSITRTEFLDPVSDRPGPGEPEPAWDLSALDWEQVDDHLKAAIEELRPEFRTALLLWGIEGMSYREIADVLRIPVGTVMSRLYRARRFLMEKLEGAHCGQSVKSTIPMRGPPSPERSR